MAAALVNLFTSVIFSAFFGVFTILAFGVFATFASGLLTVGVFVFGLEDDELEDDEELEDDLEELELSDEDLRSRFDFDRLLLPVFVRFSRSSLLPSTRTFLYFSCLNRPL